MIRQRKPHPEVDPAAAEWFLSPQERGNPWTKVDQHHGPGVSWSVGNRITPLIHGATYFKRLYETICDLEPGDWVHFTDWRGDADELLDGPGTEVGRVLADVAERGVQVRGLIWRSHPALVKFSEEQNLELAKMINERGGEVLLDERVRRGGSHHQKLFLIRHPRNEDRDVAFMGGIDLCHGRRDDERHLGDRQVYELDERYGPTPPWHDVQLELKGPVVYDLALTFRERWEDPTPIDHRNPIRKMFADRAHEPEETSPLPAMAGPPKPVGTHAAQVLRTYLPRSLRSPSRRTASAASPGRITRRIAGPGGSSIWRINTSGPARCRRGVVRGRIRQRQPAFVDPRLGAVLRDLGCGARPSRAVGPGGPR